MNEERRVGIELEFHGLTPIEAAEVVANHFQGEIHQKTEDAVEIQTPLGLFETETDAQLIKRLSEASHKNKQSNNINYEGWLKKVIETASKDLVPTELVCPPITASNIDTIVELHQKLFEAGAAGSSESIRFAFAAQLNPEITEITVDKVLNEFKSFLILSDWLKDQIKIDTTRVLTSYTADFPTEYQKMIFADDYKPNMSEFIDDYLKYNPTRNRSCDMLPLFMHIDEERVKNVIKDELVKARPTYHYRMPNCQLSMKSWTIEVEWKRWLVVEKLAQSPFFDDLCKLHRSYINNLVNFGDRSHLIELNNYVERLR